VNVIDIFDACCFWRVTMVSATTHHTTGKTFRDRAKAVAYARQRLRENEYALFRLTSYPRVRKVFVSDEP
jgi:hypothetical protein